MKKLILVMAFVFAAAPALAYEPVPEPDAIYNPDVTIYDPNVPVPSYDGIQSLQILRPDYGLGEELHLGQPWNQLFENGWLDRQQGN